MTSKFHRSLTKLPTKPKEDSTLIEDLTNRKTNIKVIARFRPFIELEKKIEGSQELKFQFPDDSTVLVPCNDPAEPYMCDQIFPPNSLQVEVYEATGKDTVKDVLEGYNGTIFAFGQTGSGKTHTMMGNLLDYHGRGLIPRCISQIFESASSSQKTEFIIKCSILEIYNEKLRDLLGESDSLKIKENVRRGIYIEGLTEVFVASEDEIFDVLQAGEKSRTVASTKMNEVSSRSHLLFMLEIRQKFENDTEKRGVLNLIDLAGSEKIKHSGVTGMKLEEAKKINLSLSALGNVIHALTSLSEHVPYRDSKLTRLLQESLGGNFKTSLIVTCSPAMRNIEETVKTLKFAQRAKKIKTSAKINFKTNAESYIKIIESLKKQLAEARLQIRSSQSVESSPILLSPILKKNNETVKSENCIHLFSMEDSGSNLEDNLNKTSKLGIPELSTKKLEELTENLQETKEENKELKTKIRGNQEKLIKSEEKSHEYYEMYHKLLLEMKGNEGNKLKLEKKNIRLKNQLDILKRHLAKLENRAPPNYESRNFCEFEVNKWKHCFIVSTEESDEDISQEPSEKFVNLPIEQELLNRCADYSSALRAKLVPTSEIDIQHTVFNLKNQVLQAEVINNDLVLALNTLACKYSLLKEKVKLKSFAHKMQNERIKTLEDIINHLHHSYTKIVKHYRNIEKSSNKVVECGKIIKPVNRRNTLIFKSFISNPDSLANSEFAIRDCEAEAQVYIHRNLNQELQLGIETAKSELKTYKESLGKVTDMLQVAHDSHQKQMKSILLEYKLQCQIELKRRQEEISVLHEVMAHWINQYMDLQQSTGIPTSKGSGHRRSLSNQYLNMIRKLCKKTEKVTQGKIHPVFKGILKNLGDQSPPVFED